MWGVPTESQYGRPHGQVTCLIDYWPTILGAWSAADRYLLRHLTKGNEIGRKLEKKGARYKMSQEETPSSQIRATKGVLWAWWMYDWASHMVSCVSRKMSTI
jgi:hypothetical protein